MNKDNIYNKVITLMMEHNRNCSIDTLVKECDNDKDLAYDMLINILSNSIEENRNEDEDLVDFHTKMLNMMIA